VDFEIPMALARKERQKSRGRKVELTELLHFPKREDILSVALADKECARQIQAPAVGG